MTSVVDLSCIGRFAFYLDPVRRRAESGSHSTAEEPTEFRQLPDTEEEQYDHDDQEKLLPIEPSHRALPCLPTNFPPHHAYVH